MKLKLFIATAIMALVFVGTAVAGTVSAYFSCPYGAGGYAYFLLQANSTSEVHAVYYNYLTGGRWVVNIASSGCGPISGGCLVANHAQGKPYPWKISAIVESSNKPVTLALKQCG